MEQLAELTNKRRAFGVKAVGLVLGVRETSSLSHALGKAECTCQQVFLVDCKFSSKEAFSELLRGLETSQALEELSLSKSLLSPDCVSSFDELVLCLSRLANLQTVDLSCNGLAGTSVGRLFEESFAKSTRKLHNVDLSHNLVDETAFDCIVNVCRANIQLFKVDLSGNPVAHDGDRLNALQQILFRNESVALSIQTLLDSVFVQRAIQIRTKQTTTVRNVPLNTAGSSSSSSSAAAAAAARLTASSSSSSVLEASAPEEPVGRPRGRDRGGTMDMALFRVVRLFFFLFFSLLQEHLSVSSSSSTSSSSLSSSRALLCFSFYLV